MAALISVVGTVHAVTMREFDGEDGGAYCASHCALLIQSCSPPGRDLHCAASPPSLALLSVLLLYLNSGTRDVHGRADSAWRVRIVRPVRFLPRSYMQFKSRSLFIFLRFCHHNSFAVRAREVVCFAIVITRLITGNQSTPGIACACCISGREFALM